MKNLSNYISFQLIPSKQFPRNLEFSAKPNSLEFKQPGIFFLHYRGELIYIGFTNNNQDVIAERVVRQLATITLRDHRIQFSNIALSQLSHDPEFYSYFIFPVCTIANDDFQTSKNRVAFASHYWDEFKNFDNNTLARFTIDWFPSAKMKSSQSIDKYCHQLKLRYRPRCNKEYNEPSF
jgi:hypothetical protein